MYLKKPIAFFIKTLFFSLIMLLFDFNILIKQIIVKNGCFFYKNAIKTVRDFSKKTDVFIKTIPMFFYHYTD